MNATDEDPGASELMAMLYGRFQRDLYARALYLTNYDKQWAEDVVQETFIRAWRNAGRLSLEPSMLRGWLYTVARRIVIDGWRSRQIRPREVELTSTEIMKIPDEAEHSLSGIMISDILGRLTDKHRSAVYETYVRGHTIKEAARTLGVPEGTIKSRLHSAAVIIRQALLDWG